MARKKVKPEHSAEVEAVLARIRDVRQQQKKRMYEQAKRNRKESAANE